jgi:hypothetical protein
MSRVHDLKVWPPYFEKLLTGEKTFEARRDDRGFAVGDELVLHEWDPATAKYTHRTTHRLVTYILRGPGFGVEAGHVILALGMRGGA